MPYIITVNRPGFLPEQDPYAVATIEEARDAADKEARVSFYGDVNEDDWVRVEAAHGLSPSESQAGREDRGPDAIDLLSWDCMALPESGGTVGPLPDGYVIEVRAVTWGELADYAGESIGHEPPDDFQAILDAYNGQ